MNALTLSACAIIGSVDVHDPATSGPRNPRKPSRRKSSPARRRDVDDGPRAEVQRAGLSGLAEGQKVSFEVKVDPKRGKSSAENLRVG